MRQTARIDLGQIACQVIQDVEYVFVNSKEDEAGYDAGPGKSTLSSGSYLMSTYERM